MKKKEICQPAKQEETVKLIIAAFDFDGTITTRDSLPLFFIYESGFFKTFWKLFCHIPQFIFCLLMLISRQQVKESLIKSFFKGRPIDKIKEEGRNFVESCLKKILKQEALDKISWHQKQGHTCILVSANLDVYLNYFSHIYLFDKCICSIVDSKDGLVTGKLKGLNCYGKEKVNRLKEAFGEKENYTLYAYGDSKGDQELLEFADYPFYRAF